MGFWCSLATHSSTLAWRIPWREEPCRLQSMGSQRVRHYWATSLSFFFLAIFFLTWNVDRVLLHESWVGSSVLGSFWQLCFWLSALMFWRLRAFPLRTGSNTTLLSMLHPEEARGAGIQRLVNLCASSVCKTQWQEHPLTGVTWK